MNTQANEFVAEQMKWAGRIQGEQAVKALKKNYFDAHYFETPSEVVAEVLKYVNKGSLVAFGGSQTARQLNLQYLVQEKGAVLLDHNAQGLSPDEKMEVMRRQLMCDVFICSSNAISMQGELYNVDGNGNRVAAMTFGPKKVIVIAGVNKLCLNEDAAWQRIKMIAAPVNFKRLNRPNPCVQTGVCMDCHIPTRGCNIYVAFRRKPATTDMSVFIVNETLGF